jgi:hypothetical protein
MFEKAKRGKSGSPVAPYRKNILVKEESKFNRSIHVYV